MAGEFPAFSLVPNGGRIHALLFENALVVLKRNLFWSFTVKFKARPYKDTEIEPSMTIDWIMLPIRRWQNLVGVKLKGNYGDEGIEASFFVWEHDYGNSFSLEVLERREMSFLVRMGMNVEFTGYDGGDKDPHLPVHAECWLPFIGIMVPEKLGDSYPSIPEARQATEEFADMRGYSDPVGKGRTFSPIE